MTSEAGELPLIRTPPRRRLAGDERALVRGAQSGSKADLEELFRRHWPPAYRAAYYVVRDRAAAEDIAQEAFLAALRALDRFDRRRPFGPWLHRIVVNRAIDWARARALRAELDVEPPDSEARDDFEERDELATAIAGAITRHDPERSSAQVCHPEPVTRRPAGPPWPGDGR